MSGCVSSVVAQMSSSPRPLSLNDPGVLSGYDHRSVERGIRYAAEARVTILESGPGWVMGEVQGSHYEPYMVDVEWFDGPRGVILTDDCNCPLGGRCKHAVALIVTASRLNALSPGAGKSAVMAIPGPDWRETLSRVATHEAEATMPMALQFSVQAGLPPSYGSAPRTQLFVRPLRMGTKGRWAKSGASWRDVESPYLHYDLRGTDATHLAALRAMAQSSGNRVYSTGASPVAIDNFGPGAWAALRHAVAVGVELIGTDDTVTVELSPEKAAFGVDLTTTTDDGIRVLAGFRHEGEVVDLRSVDGGTIGTPPNGLFVVEAGRIVLIELERPLADGLVPLMRAGELAIPRHDVDDFLDVYQPQLARSVSVTSSDGSVTDLHPEFVGVVVKVEHHAVDAARLRWTVRYRRGERVTDYGLLDRTGTARDRAAEAATIASIELPTGFPSPLVDAHGRPLNLILRGAATVTLLTEVVPWLVERGQVTVEVSGDAPELRRAVGDPLIELDVSDRTGGDDHNDWFDLEVKVSIDGEPVEFAQLFSALALDEPVLVLPSGTWLHLDRPELDRLRELLDEARGLAEPTDDGSIRINRFQTSWWDELTDLGVVRSQSERWERSLARMAELSAPEPIDPPEGLAAKLRHYQQDGLDWLAFLHANELGGILADDMGLGKTVQTLALFLHILGHCPDARFLVVAPTSVVSNWHREAAMFAPDVQVRTITSTAARRGASLAEAIGDARIVVTSYALFRLESADYQALDWELLVLDEAQFVKNHRGKTYQCVRRLDARTKIAITGTPIENSLMDLWSLLSIVAPGLYPDPRRFSEVYRRPIESGRAPDLLATLRRRVAPLMRRRTKDEVLTELPPKIEQTVDVELNAKHMRLYQTQLQQQRKKVLGLVGDVDKHRFEILRSLTILRQLSLDAALIDDAHDSVGSAKIDRLLEDLTQVVAEGHRALVFSTFTRYLTRVKARLDDAGIAYSYLDGRTRRRDRAISAFTNGDVPVFVISLKAGGFGLNLTQADYCFVLDPWWNPAAETQAIDRAHRIGQANTVVVYRYVSTGTIEEKVMELKERKAALFSSVMDADDTLSAALDADDIRALIDLPPG